MLDVVVLGAGLAGLSAARALPDDSIDLKLSLKAGDVFYVRQKQNTDQTVKFGEMDINSTFSTTQTVTFAVAISNDDNADPATLRARQQGPNAGEQPPDGAHPPRQHPCQ